MENKRIWFNPDFSVFSLENLGHNTMGSHIGIRFTNAGDDFLEATMPVDERTRQPYGLLHGGASAALAETLGSVASAFVIDPGKFICVGLEINANHIYGVKEGIVTGTCKPLHLGRSTHVWDIRIVAENEKLVCISRLTVAILEKR
ncbi:MAG: phenylacetic acid degradation-related protein [Chitinophagaceae bacterium]|nr:phenylacetic acid degradation-related protein [Chitinophagaceae bacterium]